MGELIDRFGNKQAGQLILHNDWNGLVALIDETMAARDERIKSLTDEVERLKAFEPLAVALRAQHRIELSTNVHRAVLGQSTTLTARVTDFTGDPLGNLGDGTNRPWVDFVTSWGKFRRVDGFATIAGEGGRAMSVRVNGDGIAQVQLRVATEDVTEEEEEEMAAALATPVGNGNRAISDIILQAATPLAAQNAGAFGIISQAYDIESQGLRRYIDRYYLDQPLRVADRFRQRWKDHHATVMVMTRLDTDNNGTTADRGRGSASIQVVFRDWVNAWIYGDYFREQPGRINDMIEILRPRIDKDRYGRSLLDVQAEIKERVTEMGYIGRIREYAVINEAVQRISLPEQPEFMEQLVRQTQGFVGMQRTLEFAHANTPMFDNEGAALTALTGLAAQGDVNLDGVRGQVDGLAERIGRAEQNAEDVVGKAEGRLNDQFGRLEAGIDQRVANFVGQFDQFDSELSGFRGQMAGLQSEVRGISQTVPALRGELDLFQEKQSQIVGDVGRLQGSIGRFERDLLAPNGKITQLEGQVVTLEGQVQAFEVEGVEPRKVATGLVDVARLNTDIERVLARLNM